MHSEARTKRLHSATAIAQQTKIPLPTERLNRVRRIPMKFRSEILLVLGAMLGVFAAPAAAQHYVQKNLVSDMTLPNNPDGSKVLVDPNLKNPWGLTRSGSGPNGGSPWWTGNNNSGTSSLYAGDGSLQNFFPEPNGQTGNFITVPPPPFEPKATSAPTGVVFNNSQTDFLVSPGNPAIFIFATEDGTISGWAPGVNLTEAVIVVDHSDNGSAHSAVYKGATSAQFKGNHYLYVTNFRSGEVEVYDTNFKRVHFDKNTRDDDSFDDDSIPAGYAPFNIQNIGGSLFVTYAKQDGPRHDPVDGDGFGFVDIFSPDGKLEGHLEHGDWLDAPWGVVWTPRDFGKFSNSILVGNFRSGWIAAFNGFTHKFIGFVKNPDNSLVTIDGLWSLTFGNDGDVTQGGAGPATTLFFTAGPNHEQDGLFGTLLPIDAEQDGSYE
jgi:uncharacterized protein (TIGR03118 family)